MGDRVAPYASGAKDRKPIGLPRAAPLVQVTPPPGTMIQGGKPSLASIPKTAQNSVQPKRSRVSPDPPPSSTQPSVLSPTPEDQQLSTPAGMQRPRTFETGTTDQPTASTLIRYNSIGGEDAAAIAAAAGLPDPSQRLSAASDAAAERGESVSPDLMATDSPEHRIGRLEIEKVKQRYSKLAKERCAKAMAEAAERAKRVKANRRQLPPGVWYGFHLFWPREVLEGRKTELDKMDDHNFLKRVQQLMSDERVVETFAFFDADSSGTISSRELRPLVQMVESAATTAQVNDMVKTLDINKDGEIDLWEFCVAIQKRHEDINQADIDAEVDEAFLLLFGGSPDVGEAELRQVMQGRCTTEEFTDDEFEGVLRDLEERGMSVRDGKRIPVERLRGHPSFR